ncbi:MAG: ethanolamine utilization protein [Betaproteobacteria bacterium]|nr:ethanolamine utilization protein [Betaproteobacteria bacterium]
MLHPSLAFVDLETTGLSPTYHRIAEIGIVTVEDGNVEEWTSLVNPGRRVSPIARSYTGISDDMLDDAPRFSEIAGDVERRLHGRLFIAHNARFDHAFLKSEFNRVSIGFQPDVVCTAILSRKLYPQFPCHNLDALMLRHALTAPVRHRALPDARLLWDFWQTVHRDFAAETISSTVSALLAQPLLPPHLDIGLLEDLPECPGVYVFNGEGGRPLHVGRAANLKRQARNYFRLDRNCARALKLSHEIKSIEWRRTEGALGARLLEARMAKTMAAPSKSLAGPAGFLRIVPSAVPSVAAFVASDDLSPDGDNYFWPYASERKARNALRRFATKHRLCTVLLGLTEPGRRCDACNDQAPGSGCAAGHARLQHLARLVTAFARFKVRPWPYAGPIGIRERRDLLVINRWHYLGTARNEAEAYALLQSSPVALDWEIYRILIDALPKLRRRSTVELRQMHCNPLPGHLADYDAGPTTTREVIGKRILRLASGH